MRLKWVTAGLAAILAMPAMAGDELNPNLLEELVQASFPRASVRSMPESRCEPRPVEASRGGASRPLLPCFQVIAPPVAEELTVATSVLDEGPPGSRRFVQVETVTRARPAGGPQYVLLLTYTFPDIDHCNQCGFMGKVALLTQERGQWKAAVAYLEGSNLTIDRGTFVDVTGDGQPELLVDASGGANAVSEGSLWVYDLSGPALRLMVRVDTRYDSVNSGFPWARFYKTLDPARSRATGGKALVFRTSVVVRDQRIFDPPEAKDEIVPYPAAGQGQ
ncbi:hypothetical protein [Paludibaculum fermentans]|uniref:FG-GAP repeat protein n=1 Tax=Paludibaculum fermentans TaxID=1473598 RepID=A0A7S7NNA7_PALFE|nr:hypothetical protein [Paludibaculum fermentans]QOY86786.1 hypothetical protein IRI77_28985 [Paludibaculum fermentans]